MGNNTKKIVEEHLGKRIIPKNSFKYVLVAVNSENSDVLDNISGVTILEEMVMTQEMVEEVGGPTLYIP